MLKERIIKFLDSLLLLAASAALLAFIADQGFILSDGVRSMICKGSFVIFGLLLLDNLAMLFIDGGPADVLKKHKTLYFVTFLLMLQFLVIRAGLYGHSGHYYTIAEIYIFYMFLFKMSKINRTAFSAIRLKPEQMFIITFVGLIILGSLLLSLPRATVLPGSMPYTDALFTSTSAVCVTGLIVVDTAAYFTMFGKIVILILIQIGGLGLMTFTSFLSIFFFKTMSFRERFLMSDMLSADFALDVQKIIGKILTITFTIEALGAALLFTKWHSCFKTLGEALFHSVFHAVSSFCNAGFSTFSNSLMDYRGDLSVNLTVMFLIVIGGLGFVVIVDLFQPSGGRKKLLMLQSKIVLATTAGLILLGAVVIFFLESDGLMAGMGLKEKILASFFHSVTPRTAGFNTLNTAGFSLPVLLMTMVFMFIGASPGSTGGGVKTTTFGILIATVWATMKNRESVDVFYRRIPARIIHKAVSLIVISAGYLFTVFMILIMSEDLNVTDLLFELMSAFGTVGLSTGITASLSTAGKIIIMLTMFVGRLGPVTLAMALSRPETAPVNYPEETSIMVG